MSAAGPLVSLEDQIELWRAYLGRRGAIHAVDVAELEDHLREQIAVLMGAGLAADEAFLIAVKRMGSLDAVSREFATEHSDRLWKQLVASSEDQDATRSVRKREAVVAFSLAGAAAMLIKAPALFGTDIGPDFGFYARNLSFFVLPLLAGYFAWKRQLSVGASLWIAAAFLAAIIPANAYPFAHRGFSEPLTALHLPIALWLAVGVAYAGGRWNEVGGRMNFVRFSGELFIYFILIALGGLVLAAFMAMIFQAAGISVQRFFESWLLPCGAVGAIIIASWLVEAKQSVIENMAPVLARLFTPLFAIVLVAFLGALVWTGRGVDIQRDVLIVFDLLLVLVVGLLVYSVSARDPRLPPGVFDFIQVALLASALVADAIALWAIAARITEFGLTPNRVAALGENVILLINLVGSTVLYVRFLRGMESFTSLEAWQTGYLPVYAGWAAFVVIVFPPSIRVHVGAKSSPALGKPADAPSGRTRNLWQSDVEIKQIGCKCR